MLQAVKITQHHTHTLNVKDQHYMGSLGCGKDVRNKTYKTPQNSFSSKYLHQVNIAPKMSGTDFEG